LSENVYTVKNLDGGWKTYSAVYNQSGKLLSVNTEEDLNVSFQIDANGLSCPGPIMEVPKI
jgi:hypothetical protein